MHRTTLHIAAKLPVYLPARMLLRRLKLVSLLSQRQRELKSFQMHQQICIEIWSLTICWQPCWSIDNRKWARHAWVAQRSEAVRSRDAAHAQR